jgi:microcystin degradation protein MlrC
MVGGGYAPEYCQPIHFRGTVERLLDVDFVLDGHIGKNLPIHMGRGAVVRSGDVTVLFVEKTGPGSSPRLYETAGLDPRSCGIVVAKSPAGFRADYESFTAATFLADCPGCASANWSRLNFFRINRPLWPLDQIDRPQAAKWCGTTAWLGS